MYVIRCALLVAVAFVRLIEHVCMCTMDACRLYKAVHQYENSSKGSGRRYALWTLLQGDLCATPTVTNACVLVDQLVCPVLICKLWLCERDIKLICGDAMLLQFQTTLQRKRV